MTDENTQRTKDHKLACIHRAGCPKPEVCGKVGHCTSMTEADLKLHADMSREEVDAVMDRTTAARTSNLDAFRDRIDAYFGPRKEGVLKTPYFLHETEWIELRNAFVSRVETQPGASNLRVKLLKDVYDDGQDHHPPGYIARKGDVVVIHSIQTAVVSHHGAGHGFVVHDGELELMRQDETTDVLKTIYRLAGGHAIECQCRQCEIFELLEPIVGNSSRSAVDPPVAHKHWCAKLAPSVYTAMDCNCGAVEPIAPTDHVHSWDGDKCHYCKFPKRSYLALECERLAALAKDFDGFTSDTLQTLVARNRSAEKARELHAPDCQARLTHELGFKTLSPCTCGAENGKGD